MAVNDVTLRTIEVPGAGVKVHLLRHEEVTFYVMEEREEGEFVIVAAKPFEVEARDEMRRVLTEVSRELPEDEEPGGRRRGE